jgi:1-acyl-sn-glycerol-3-phosphate acyltransferase
VSEKLNKPLFEAAVELPNPLNEVQKAAGVIAIPAGGSGRLVQLEENTKKVLADQKGLVVMYPEGGTSGKRNQGGPYDLDHFQTGAFVIASHLGIPVLPVCQYFNPDGGFEIAILPPVNIPNTEDREYFATVAQKAQADMQAWLNSRK